MPVGLIGDGCSANAELYVFRLAFARKAVGFGKPQNTAVEVDPLGYVLRVDGKHCTQDCWHRKLHNFDTLLVEHMFA